MNNDADTLVHRHVLSEHPCFSSAQSRVDAILRSAPDYGQCDEQMIRVGGLTASGVSGDATRGGEATPTEPVVSDHDTDGSDQNNDADAGEQPHHLPAGRPVLVEFQHENGSYVIAFRRVGGNGDLHEHVDGYGDDAYRGGGFGAVPASDEEIARLEKATVADTREAECVVCMESFEQGDEIRKMPCSHGFHQSCIFKWLRVSHLCPHCRFALSPKHN